MARRHQETAARRQAAARTTAAPDRIKYSIIFARETGLLAGAKTVVVRGRMPPALVKRAKQKTGIVSDTELLRAALAHLVASDDYADWLIAHRGAVSADLDLGL
jgi:Zn-dependent oligopeptidase